MIQFPVKVYECIVTVPARTGVEKVHTFMCDDLGGFYRDADAVGPQGIELSQSLIALIEEMVTNVSQHSFKITHNRPMGSMPITIVTAKEAHQHNGLVAVHHFTVTITEDKTL